MSNEESEYVIVTYQYVQKPGANPDQDALDRWTSGGYEGLRYKYNLDTKSTCIDLGAFHCEWGIKISDMYGRPTIYAFEPIPSIFAIARDNISGKRRINHCPCMPGCVGQMEYDCNIYNNIRLFNYGVGKETGESKISLGPAFGAGSSLFDSADTPVKINMRAIKDIFLEFDFKNVDLMKINIEGSEYDVLEQLLETDMHKLVQNFQIQFHRVGDNYLERYRDIKNKLSRTHRLTYECPFIWENWERV